MAPVARRAAAAGIAAALALVATPATPQDAERLGPLQGRDELLPAQPRLQLPAASPDVFDRGRGRVRIDFAWGNDFVWSQTRQGELPGDRRYLLDGEHRSLVLLARVGLGARLEVAVRVPLYWRGGGLLDGVIDWFHGWTGFPGNAREAFFRDRLRFEGRTGEGAPLVWTGSGGAGLGDVELGLKRALVGGRGGPGWSLSLLGRMALPTSTGAFAGGGAELGGQLLAARSLGDRADLYLGAGATWWPEERQDGLRYAGGRGHGFLGVEWRAWRCFGFLVQVEGASRMIEEVADFPGRHSYLRMGARWRLSERWTLEGGFTENLTHQQATTDFGISLGLSRGF